MRFAQLNQNQNSATSKAAQSSIPSVGGHNKRVEASSHSRLQNLANQTSNIQKTEYLKKQADNFIGRNELVQAMFYRTGMGRNRRGMQGHVEVQSTKEEVIVKGRLIGPEGESVAAKGSVRTPEYKVSENRAIAAKKIRDVEPGFGANYFNPSDALRVQNLSADPRGLKLGHLLTYHHGLEAHKRGKPYVIAQKVSDARGPFYTPLGFKDYNASKPWEGLDNEEKALNIVARSGYIPDSDLPPILARIQEVREEKINSDMIIDTAELIQNSKAFYERSWVKE